MQFFNVTSPMVRGSNRLKASSLAELLCGGAPWWGREASIDDFEKPVWALVQRYTAEPENVPYGGRYEGVAGIRRYFEELADCWQIGELDISETIVSEDGKSCAAIGVETQAKALPTGRRADIAFVWIFKTDGDGRFTYVREYNDTHAMYQAFV